MIESLIYAILKKFLLDNNLNYLVKPQSTTIGSFPALVYRVISNNMWNTLNGRGTTETRRIQIDIYTDTKTQGTVIREKLMSNLPDGILGGNFVIYVVYDNQTIKVFVDSIRHATDGDTIDKDTGKYRHFIDVFITFWRDEYIEPLTDI